MFIVFLNPSLDFPVGGFGAAVLIDFQRNTPNVGVLRLFYFQTLQRSSGEFLSGLYITDRMERRREPTTKSRFIGGKAARRSFAPFF